MATSAHQESVTCCVPGFLPYSTSIDSLSRVSLESLPLDIHVRDSAERATLLVSIHPKYCLLYPLPVHFRHNFFPRPTQALHSTKFLRFMPSSLLPLPSQITHSHDPHPAHMSHTTAVRRVISAAPTLAAAAATATAPIVIWSRRSGPSGAAHVIVGNLSSPLRTSLLVSRPLSAVANDAASCLLLADHRLLQSLHAPIHLSMSLLLAR
jgi:hypothetical protein